MSQSKGGGRGGGGGATKGKKSGKSDAAEEKREDALQAVILTDSFQDRFMPFTVEKPRCLLPLANTPLIEYTLEFLAMNGVQEVFIYTGNHTDQIETYIHESPRWSPSSRLNPFSSLEFIRVSDARSIGDFLRDLDKRGVIGGDFVLVHGDLVANIPLDAALAAHRARREANRDAIMTVLLRDGGLEEHRTKSHGVTPVFVIDPSSGRCLHYEETSPLQSDHYLNLDPTILEHAELEVRSDLIDCGIDICTPDVLALWSESFDYELPRKNFLHGVLKDWELNGKLIHAEVFEEGYAARANNLQMYEAISRDILGRWTYPFVPDNNLVPGNTYKLMKDSVYREKGTSVESGTKLSSSVLGARTTLGAGTIVSNSFIGRRCVIGKNVKIEDSYVWDDARIEDGAVVAHSVLASSVTVGKNCSIPAGSLVSFGVQISDNITLPPSSAVSLFSADRNPVKADTSLLGPQGAGAAFKDEEEEEDIDPSDPTVLQKPLIYSLAGLNISTSSISTFSSDIEDSDDDEPFLQASDPSARSRLSSFTSDDSSTPAGSNAAFHADAVNGLLDALRSDDDFESAKLEFMGLRLANDASDAAVRRAVAVAFARRAAELTDPEHGGLAVSKAAEAAIAARKGAARFVKEVGIGGGAQKDQVDFVLALQKALVGLVGRAVEAARGGELLAGMLQQMYSQDVLEEEGILTWWDDERAAAGEDMSAVKARCQPLVEWLQDAEEEDSDEDEDDDE
ncbi:eIF4-gamma/eIF5/eIF2-epsilon [Pleurostoma richardsiae]|uniref:Mannose-1-phosphate guanyltransferase n=1 Tax=Pleurostoma richardsiae TaxID=41990 RepID=A0AA38RFZ7_9PEZI|nr:eIF4-gamma/eIF5/eIF2-epsilon [Pleurostoma richardsiae]